MPVASLPDSLRVLLPRHDRRAHALELEDGRWLVAGRDVLHVLAEGGVVDQGVWCEVQSARWDAEARTFTLVWVDPAREAIVGGTVSADPAAFMGDVTEAVSRQLVLHKEVRADNGTLLSAQVRRAPGGGLFSVVTASGVLTEQGEGLADSLEKAVREAVGLD